MANFLRLLQYVLSLAFCIFLLHSLYQLKLFLSFNEIDTQRTITKYSSCNNENNYKHKLYSTIVWPTVRSERTPPAIYHIVEDGVMKSTSFNLFRGNITNYIASNDTIFIATFDGSYDFCEKLLRCLTSIIAGRNSTATFPIYIIDYSDNDQNLRCKNIEHYIGIPFTFYYQRSIVENRHWNTSRGWVDLGSIINFTRDNIIRHHTPYAVRTDTVVALNDILEQKGNSLKDDIELFQRPIDVTNFWPLDGTTGVFQGGKPFQQLRDKVSHIIEKLATQSNYTSYLNLSGLAAHAGRSKVQYPYVRTMLDSKIIIVVQRDRWEDHYRLFEALVSGALVMTDTMLSLPSCLQDGKSVIEYRDEYDLRDKITYFILNEKERIKIARQGRCIAMSMHRSWHRLESIIFHKNPIKCICDDCSFTVYPNERIGVKNQVLSRINI